MTANMKKNKSGFPIKFLQSIWAADSRESVANERARKDLLLPLNDLPAAAMAALKVMAADRPKPSEVKAAATVLIMVMLKRDPQASRTAYIVSTAAAVVEFSRIGKRSREDGPTRSAGLTGRCAARLSVAMP